MRRLTITLPDPLNHELEQYLLKRPGIPRTAVVQQALEYWLKEQALRERGHRKAKKSYLGMPAYQPGSGKSDVSLEHDRYLAEGRR